MCTKKRYLHVLFVCHGFDREAVNTFLVRNHVTLDNSNVPISVKKISTAKKINITSIPIL